MSQVYNAAYDSSDNLNLLIIVTAQIMLSTGKEVTTNNPSEYKCFAEQMAFKQI